VHQGGRKVASVLEHNTTLTDLELTMEYGECFGFVEREGGDGGKGVDDVRLMCFFSFPARLCAPGDE